MTAIAKWVRPHRGMLGFLALYAVLQLVLSTTSERAGVFLPSGALDLGPMLLAVTVLVMRLALFFVVAPLLTYRVVRGLPDPEDRPETQ